MNQWWLWVVPLSWRTVNNTSGLESNSEVCMNVLCLNVSCPILSILLYDALTPVTYGYYSILMNNNSTFQKEKASFWNVEQVLCCIIFSVPTEFPWKMVHNWMIKARTESWNPWGGNKKPPKRITYVILKKNTRFYIFNVECLPYFEMQSYGKSDFESFPSIYFNCKLLLKVHFSWKAYWVHSAHAFFQKQATFIRMYSETVHRVYAFHAIFIRNYFQDWTIDITAQKAHWWHFR